MNPDPDRNCNSSPFLVIKGVNLNLNPDLDRNCNSSPFLVYKKSHCIMSPPNGKLYHKNLLAHIFHNLIFGILSFFLMITVLIPLMLALVFVLLVKKCRLKKNSWLKKIVHKTILKLVGQSLIFVLCFYVNIWKKTVSSCT